MYHLYVVELGNGTMRDQLRAYLAEQGINAGIHYPFAVHEQPAYRHVRSGPMTVTEQLARTVLSLPLYPELSDADHERVCVAVRSFFTSGP